MGEDFSALKAALAQGGASGPFDVAIVLGSGLGSLARQVEGAVSLPYSDFPCFPPSTIAGHEGRLVAGTLCGLRVLLFVGRHHLYQGYSARQVTVTVRIARDLGARRLLLTSAVGGIAEDFRVGDFMFVADHLNFLGDNPLRGESCDPFIDLSRLYALRLFAPLRDALEVEGIPLRKGVLAAMAGPSYETPAEIRALKLLGADAVSMSTVPEAIMGRYCEMEVVAISMVSNPAAGLASDSLSHEEVLQAGQQGADRFAVLVKALLALWAAPAT